MSSFRRKGTWGGYGTKLILALSALMVTGLAFASRYRIGVDMQRTISLPYHLYLIDLQNHVLKRGALYTFSARGLEPIYPEGTRMIKQLVGLPGDAIRIDPHHRIFINGKVVGKGLPLAKQ